jgi:hypothetical protein
LAADITAEELDNMTLAEIEALKQQEIQRIGNMTLSMLKEQGPQMNGRGGPFMGFQLEEGDDFLDGHLLIPGTGPR